MPICRECNQKFKGEIFINGQRAHRSGYVYCWDCSPYKTYSRYYDCSKPIIDGKKECIDCKEWKSVDDFYKRKRGYYASYCKQCSHRQLREANNKFKQLCVNYKGG